MSTLQSLTGKGNYTLVICEKPDAARRVAEALGETSERYRIGYSEVFLVEREGKRYAICSSLGHLYTIADLVKRRSIYPAYDVEWVPISRVGKSARIAERIRVISELSKKAGSFINACDFDVEGETIGYNILKYACGGKESVALRAKFSTLTAEELRDAVAKAEPWLGGNLAEAGRTRHIVDFMYGINLSRVLVESIVSATGGYRTMSIGRVQGPTLSYVVEREIAIRNFVPLPYWSVDAIIRKDGRKLTANYEKDKIFQLKLAQKVIGDCTGKDGTVKEVKKSVFREPPLTPFNLGDLQREAYRCIGLTPSQTLSMAERLYLDALISYPRTSSQKLPPSINYKKILTGLTAMTGFRDHALSLLSGKLVPHEGSKDDTAHPAIYPTGEVPKRSLQPKEFKLYALIVRRFFAVFAEDAVRERVAAIIDIAGHNFKVNGRTTIRAGWLAYYADFISHQDRPIPDFVEGEKVKVFRVNLYDKFEQSPPRFNQSSLLAKMEEDSIGTKATRAEIIQTLYSRGYIAEASMSATSIGFSVVETMQAHSPAILSVDMTREIETSLEGIETGDIDGGQVVERVMDELSGSLYSMRRAEAEIGRRLNSAVRSAVAEENTLGICPVCKEGNLRIIRSRASGKRFVGCTSYSKGCRASAPLPQRGIVRPLRKACKTCGWPTISARFSRFPMTFCVNVRCPTKGKKWVRHG